MRGLRHDDQVDRVGLETAVLGTSHPVLDVRDCRRCRNLFGAGVSGDDAIESLGQAHSRLTAAAGAIPCQPVSSAQPADVLRQWRRVRRPESRVLDGERREVIFEGGVAHHSNTGSQRTSLVTELAM